LAHSVALGEWCVRPFPGTHFDESTPDAAGDLEDTGTGGYMRVEVFFLTLHVANVLHLPMGFGTD